MGSDDPERWEVNIDQETIEKLREHAGGRPLKDLIEHAIRCGVDLLEPLASQGIQEKSIGLSSRQREVLRLLRMGFSVKEISVELDIGEASVRTHIARLRDRLGTEDLLALRFGSKHGHCK